MRRAVVVPSSSRCAGSWNAGAGEMPRPRSAARRHAAIRGSVCGASQRARALAPIVWRSRGVAAGRQRERRHRAARRPDRWRWRSPGGDTVRSTDPASLAESAGTSCSCASAVINVGRPRREASHPRRRRFAVRWPAQAPAHVRRREVRRQSPRPARSPRCARARPSPRRGDVRVDVVVRRALPDEQHVHGLPRPSAATAVEQLWNPFLRRDAAERARPGTHRPGCRDPRRSRRVG